MRKLILTALATAIALPALSAPAAAQSRGEIRRERQDVREEQRELDRAYRSGDPRRIRAERRDVREERREYRGAVNDRRADRNWGRDDWRGWRDRNRAVYARGNWRAPFRYNSFRPGVRIAPTYFGQRYWINDPYRYRLPAIRGPQRWVRHYDDVILVDTRRGVVLNVLRNFYF